MSANVPADATSWWELPFKNFETDDRIFGFQVSDTAAREKELARLIGLRRKYAIRNAIMFVLGLASVFLARGDASGVLILVVFLVQHIAFYDVQQRIRALILARAMSARA